MLLVAFLLVNAPNWHLSLVLASVVQGYAVNCNTSYGIILNGGSAGRAGWRAVLPNGNHEFSSGCLLLRRAVSSEISDLCEISDLLLFVSYCASQNIEIKFGNNFFDVYCVN